MTDILLITPPFLQFNAPYPATAYLKGYLSGKGYVAVQEDLSIETISAVFSSGFIREVFCLYRQNGLIEDRPGLSSEQAQRMDMLSGKYISVVDTVIAFLRGEDPTLANLICMPDFLPQGKRFEDMDSPEELFGRMGIQDFAKYLSTLFILDLSDLIRSVITPHFDTVRYAEQIAVSLPDFSALEKVLDEPINLIEETMTGILDEMITRHDPRIVCFTVPFPGNLLPALRCAQYIKEKYPRIQTVAGGGYPSTELRQMTDKGIFRYFDYVVLDDGEESLARIIEGVKIPQQSTEYITTYTADGYSDNCDKGKISHAERGCPDFGGLPHGEYFSTLSSPNPMHRLWSDGRWNKMMLAHGCYWSRCAFCDTSLDYISRFNSVDAGTLADWMEQVIEETGSRGFHFVDEAAPPALLKELSLELLRRNLKVSWWTNVRFDNSFTGDLCRLMAEAGCIAISGGLEVASDRLLEMISKGITIESATMAMRNFFYSGIMVHAYLMYGFPTQTLQETVDSLEVVRQMFRAELIDSAFWHRYAMTVHSDTGQNPDKYGVTIKQKNPNSFANNEIRFTENRAYDIRLAGEALRTALSNYMSGNGLDRAVNKWFAGKAPSTTIEESLVTDQLIKPDRSRIYSAEARVVWIGGGIKTDADKVFLYGPSSKKEMSVKEGVSGFIEKTVEVCSDLSRKVTLEEVAAIYSDKVPGESFLMFYHSKKWDILRNFGLLQL